MSKKNITSVTPIDVFRESPKFCPTTFSTSSNYVFDFDNPGYAEYNDLPSETQPNQSYSVKELLERHISGSLPDISHNTYYDVEDPHSDQAFDSISPTDRPDFDLADYAALNSDLASRRNAARQVRENSTPKVETQTEVSVTGQLDIPSDVPD